MINVWYIYLLIYLTLIDLMGIAMSLMSLISINPWSLRIRPWKLIAKEDDRLSFWVSASFQGRPVKLPGKLYCILRYTYWLGPNTIPTDSQWIPWRWSFFRSVSSKITGWFWSHCEQRALDKPPISCDFYLLPGEMIQFDEHIFQRGRWKTTN